MEPRALSLSGTSYDRIAGHLRATDQLLTSHYRGDDGCRQPIHSCYVPADHATVNTPTEWGRDALAAAAHFGGTDVLARHLGLSEEQRAEIVPLVEAKLQREPIEDLRIDLEDGYGLRSDDTEDEHTVAAAHTVAQLARARHENSAAAPQFCGIRFKCFEAETRARGLRTLDLFLTTLVTDGGLTAAGVSHDGLPDGLVLTFPKVSTVAQVEALVDVLSELEDALDLARGRLGFEIQVETPPVILGADGSVPLPGMIAAGQGRVTALHYGTYDYSASLGVAGPFQSLEHPGADHAKHMMQLAAAGTGVRLSDGSSNVLPLGDSAQRKDAWALHARLVRRSLERAYYQGWDLHAHQLLTRYLVNYDFYRSYFDQAAHRLTVYAARNTPGIESSEIADEPATARALAGFVYRGVMCGAIQDEELHERTGMTRHALRQLAYPHRCESAAPDPTT